MRSQGCVKCNHHSSYDNHKHDHKDPNHHKNDCDCKKQQKDHVDHHVDWHCKNKHHIHDEHNNHCHCEGKHGHHGNSHCGDHHGHSHCGCHHDHHGHTHCGGLHGHHGHCHSVCCHHHSCRRFICDHDFSIRLGGLHQGLNFRLRQLIGCHVDIHLEDDKKVHGEICFVGSNFVEMLVDHKRYQPTPPAEADDEVHEEKENGDVK